MERFIGIIGVFTILCIAYLLSNDKKNIDSKLIVWGLSLQLFFSIIILKIPGGKWVFNSIDSVIKKILDFSVQGSKFLFGNFPSEKTGIFLFCGGKKLPWTLKQWKITPTFMIKEEAICSSH